MRLVRGIVRQAESPLVELPAFLCPALLGVARSHNSPHYHQRRSLHSSPEFSKGPSTSAPVLPEPTKLLGARLPLQCAGCGALSQIVNKDEPGFYNLKRRTVKEYVSGKAPDVETEEDRIIQQSLENATSLDPELARQLAFNIPIGKPGKNTTFSYKTCHLTSPIESLEPIEAPICERCHNLKHHETGVSIIHPSIRSLEDTISESPHKYNHIYHVVDAADFPMSIIPGIHKLLNATPQRSMNRRSKTGKFYHGKKTEISFIITRSDLLAPKKEQVDSMMPYLRTVLRGALGRDFTDSRLGNIRCVSAKRSWWTKELKEDIWNRGGGGWMVGKVNVGKSQLIHEVFPKGRRGQLIVDKPLKPAEIEETQPWFAEQPKQMQEMEENKQITLDALDTALSEDELDDQYLETLSLLPPLPTETDYPAMPLVSSLPGTTASPIRIPFGSGKGELVDLPGLSRGDLELHVQPEHRSSLVMRSRVRPEQQVIKPTQSLLLGGFIRITPMTPDLMFLAYVFNPLTPHLTSTERAIGTQTQTRNSTVENISLPGTGSKIASAGTFQLQWDVTKARAGPITARDAANIHVDRLPYRVMAADILIEGCGWVELVAQIRKKPGFLDRGEDEFEFPAVEVFSPEGKFVGVRPPLNAWLNVRFKPGAKALKGRPRKSMKGHDKQVRARARHAREN